MIPIRDQVGQNPCYPRISAIRSWDPRRNFIITDHASETLHLVSQSRGQVVTSNQPKQGFPQPDLDIFTFHALAPSSENDQEHVK